MTLADNGLKQTKSKGVALPDPRVEPTISVPRAGELVGLCRDAAYDAARRGDLPTLKFGRSVRVPTARLLAMLGLDEQGAA